MAPDATKNYRRNKKNHCAVFAVSETGPARDHNEDSIAFSYPENDKQNLLAIVADGMGGHNAGEVASEMACNLLLNYCLENWKQHPPQLLLQKAFLNAHQKIVEAGKSNEAQKGMGTTASMVLIKQNVCYIGHIGDSRVYLLRNGMLAQLSTDHTLVNQMFEGGEITESELENHPMKNVLLQALGTTPTIQPQVPSQGWEIQEDDRLFLCSDGVYDALHAEDIKNLLLMQNPKFVLECLSTIATARNVSDNFSALLIDFSAVETSKPAITKEQNIL
ncbi:MAG: serine/threonine-protein phosphatase [Aequorivita sp.]|nr:serine/threonine-protein phosphatase [Aequorivita sp.]